MKTLHLAAVFLGYVPSLVLAGACHTLEPDAPREAPPSETPPPGVRATVDRLAFVSGDWELVDGEDLLTEHWTEPHGDCLLGSFRWMKPGGEVWMYELLTMRDEGEGVTLRFRHFAADLVGWEEKDDPLTLRLVELSENRAVFRHYGGDGDPWTMTFHRRDADSLSVILDQSAGAKSEPQEFAYRRAR